MTDNFKPIAPPAGRDWLTNGFGVYRCMCVRCNPPKEQPTATQNAPVDRNTAPPVAQLEVVS